MKCPKCGGKTKITDVRHPTTDEVLRSRACKVCQNKFYTIEYEVHADTTFTDYWRKSKHPHLAYKNGGVKNA